jgi:hypothetical protein
MAEAYGWTFEKITGSHALIETMLTGTATTDEILFVTPRHVIESDPVSTTLTSYPLWARTPEKGDCTTIYADDGNSSDQPNRIGTANLGLGIDAGGTYTDAVIYNFKTAETLCKGKALTTRWDFTIGIGQALNKLNPDGSSLFCMGKPVD